MEETLLNQFSKCGGAISVALDKMCEVVTHAMHWGGGGGGEGGSRTFGIVYGEQSFSSR